MLPVRVLASATVALAGILHSRFQISKDDYLSFMPTGTVGTV